MRKARNVARKGSRLSRLDYLRDRYGEKHDNGETITSPGIVIIDEDEWPISVVKDIEGTNPSSSQPASKHTPRASAAASDLSPPRRKRPYSAPRRKISKAKILTEEEKQKEQNLKQENESKEKKLEWAKGLVQKREAEARERETKLESEKPFARTRDDPELNKMFEDQVRWGDPMAHLIKSKPSELILEDFSADQKMKESGFIIPQTIPDHSWIHKKIDPPPNRYGIKPGRHWDGVDRSNGHENNYLRNIMRQKLDR